MFGLSKRQKAVFDAIDSLQKEHGWCPSYAEIAIRSGMKTKSEVWRIIQQLEMRGYIKRMPGLARSLKVIPLRDDILTGFDEC